MAHQFTTSYLADSLAVLRQYKSLAERAMAQVTDAQLTQTLDPESNSIATLVKHMAGNMRSRWTDFLTTDGEKPTASVMGNSKHRRRLVRRSCICGKPAGNMFFAR